MKLPVVAIIGGSVGWCGIAPAGLAQEVSWFEQFGTSARDEGKAVCADGTGGAIVEAINSYAANGFGHLAATALLKVGVAFASREFAMIVVEDSAE